jgi:hypothetical protein
MAAAAGHCGFAFGIAHGQRGDGERFTHAGADHQDRDPSFPSHKQTPRTDAHDTTAPEQAIHNHLPIKDIGMYCPRF